VTLTVAGVNDAPIVNNDTFFPKQDTVFTSPATGVLANDSDADTAASALTVTPVTQPTNGSLVLNANGSFTYTPNTGFTGNDTFTYRVSDGAGGTADGTVTLTVNPNTAPLAANDTYTTAEDTALTTTTANGVLFNDTDSNDDPLTAQIVDQPAHGTLSLAADDGTFSYTPAANYTGPDSFTYRASDGTAQSNVATVSITLLGTMPLRAADDYTTVPSVTLTVNAANGVLTNDTDPDGAGPLTAVLVSGPASGTLSLAADGSFTYTPLPDFHDAITFTYRAKDAADAESAPATVTIVVNSVPVAVNDSYPTGEDTALVVSVANGVLDNDTDADDDTLTVHVTVIPVNGTLTLNTDGSFTYTPNPNFSGTDGFSYIANDGLADSAVATVTITVDPVNDPPTSVADSYVTGVNTALDLNAANGVLDNDTDSETPNALSAAIGTGPASGTLTLNADGSFLYTPNNNFTGVDSFTYRAADGTSQGNLATVTIKVNTPPTAADDPAYAATEDTAHCCRRAGRAGQRHRCQRRRADGGTGDEGRQWHADARRGWRFHVHAEQQLHWNRQPPTGRPTVTPTAAPATVTITVAAERRSRSRRRFVPVAIGGTLTIDAAQGVLVNDTDEEGDPLTAVDLGQPATGTVTLNPDGSFTYDPTATLHGAVSFTYKANDGTSSSATAAIVTIIINTPPVAANDTVAATEDTLLTVPETTGVLANDSDADLDSLTAALIAGPTNGTLTLNADGSYDYSPNLNFNGADSFTYAANDTFANSAGDRDDQRDRGQRSAASSRQRLYDRRGRDVGCRTQPMACTNDSDADNDALTVQVEAARRTALFARR
jgi:VCBS repeat-containing protein